MNTSFLGIIDHVGAKAGMDYFTGNLAEALAGQGVETIVCSNFSKKGKATYQTTFSGNRTSIWQKATDFYFGHFKSFLTLKRKGVKSLLFHSFETGIKEFSIFILAKLLGFRSSVIVHDVEGFTDGDSLFFKKIILKRLVKRIYTLNQFSKNVLLLTMGAELEDKITEIHHGHFIDQRDDTITREIARQRLGWKDEKRVLFFGQIKKVKGLDVLIKAFGDINTGHLLIAGKVWKDSFEQYQSLISEQKNSSLITTEIRFITDEERELLFKAADILVLPYRKIFQSGVLLMAMSYGLCVVASDLPANSAIITDGVDGVLFKNEEHADLAEKLAYLLDNQDKVDEIGEAALETMKAKYGWEEAAARIAKSLLLLQ